VIFLQTSGFTSVRKKFQGFAVVGILFASKHKLVKRRVNARRKAAKLLLIFKNHHRGGGELTKTKWDTSKKMRQGEPKPNSVCSPNEFEDKMLL